MLNMKAGTFMFFAPELFSPYKQVTFGEKTDIWALGITFYEILCGRLPYADAVDIIHLQSLILTRSINFDIIPANARPVLRRMLEPNPDKRASLANLMADDWVTNKGQDKIDVDHVEGNKHGFGNLERALAFRSKMFGQSFNNKSPKARI